MADVWLIARDRTDRLTDAETVRVGRILVAESRASRIWYPDGTPTVTVVIRDCDGALSDDIRERIAEIVGEVDVEVRRADG